MIMDRLWKYSGKREEEALSGPSGIHSFSTCEASDRTGTGAGFWNQEVVSGSEG